MSVMSLVTPVRARIWQPRRKAAPVAAGGEFPGSQGFAQLVHKAIDGPVLRYSQRVELIRRGEGMGLSRFQANLVIASVLHGRGMGQEYNEGLGAGGSGAALWSRSSRRFAPAWARLITIATVQSAILLAAWWVLH